MLDEYFEQISHDLKTQQFAVPRLILDQALLQKNIQYVQRKLSVAQHLKPRLVVKSLASLNLLKLLSGCFQTERFMVFHLPQLISLVEDFPEADILLGKPMPIHAVISFYKENLQYKNVNIQWLVDTKTRLNQYLNFAQQEKLRLQINIEIDVGLHRGGVASDDDLADMLSLIQQNPEHLTLSGLMGYDAHVNKLPKIIKKADKAFEESQEIYFKYIEMIRTQYPSLWHEQLCFNGGGSPSFCFHVKHSVCNDLSFGSMLVKPSDFDLDDLAPLQAALWIASPVLKELPYTELPGMPFLNKFPHKNKALFIYGGYWLADYVYPTGSHPHPLYGRSSNQELVNVPKNHPINVDDFVFLRPSQSEAIIPQFSHLWVYQDRHFVKWSTLRE